MGNLVSYNIINLLKESEKQEIQKYAITAFQINKGCLNDDTVIENQFYLYMLITDGCGRFEINKQPYEVSKNGFLIISPIHLFKIIVVDDNFSAKVLLTYKSILDITPSMEKVFKQLNRSLKIYKNPFLQLNDNECLCISENMNNIKRRLSQTNHHLHAEVIQNSFITFSLDWIDIWNNYHSIFAYSKEQTRADEIFSSFVKLLRVNYKEEHNVSYYASKLSLSEHHLNVVIKEITGHSVSTLIYELLYCKACILLNQSTNSVDEISEVLHFSDASSFCKFFKKRAGITPLKYRKELNS
ncbi:AraC family transcriptional regulator [uncultured Bacteroides sp.]|uniref:AraC family transcriptional regulator n=1 Tax=uncultured Bacteroides sp. TaxID=162156 RepID=UPI00261379DE|nr:AraC family transcriptional regulator [uncultured Bacteroides sp.]